MKSVNGGPVAVDVWSTLKKTAGTPDHGNRWLRWHPSQLATCVVDRGNHLPEPLAESELTELREAHFRWGADEASLSGIDHLGRSNTRVVITGQQPGLLAGPLLVIY